MSEARIPAIERERAARWSAEARRARRSSDAIIAGTVLVFPALILIPLAWMLDILPRELALPLFGPVAWVLVFVLISLVRPGLRGLGAAILAGAFALGASLSAGLAIYALFVLGADFLPFAVFALVPIAATWALLVRLLQAIEAAAFEDSPKVRLASAFAVAVIPVVVCFAIQAHAVARGDAYLAALRAGDFARIEMAAAQFRPLAPLIGVPRDAVGDRELGPIPLGVSDESSDPSTLRSMLARAAWPLR